MVLRFAATALLLSSIAAPASAACVNRYTFRTDGPRQVVTLLTGKLTFLEAQELAESIQQRKAPPLEWVAPDGKSIAKQYGPLKVVRPMPVGCDGKASGVVFIATFGAVQKPSGTMNVRLDPSTIVAFDRQ